MSIFNFVKLDYLADDDTGVYTRVTIRRWHPLYWLNRVVFWWGTRRKS